MATLGPVAPGALDAVGPLAPRLRLPRITLHRDSVYRRALGLADLTAAGISLLVLDVVGQTHLGALGLVVVPLALVLAKLLGLYDRDERVLWSSTLDEAPQVFVLSLVYTIIIWLAAGNLLPGHVHKGQFILALGTMAAGVLVGRSGAREMAALLTERERCLVLGDPSSFDHVRNRLKYGENGSGQVVLGIPVAPGGFASLADQQILHEVVTEYDIGRVVIVSGGQDTDAVLDLIREAGGMDVKVSLLPHFWDTLGSIVVDEMPGTAMLAVRRFGISKSSEAIKRGFDVLVAGLALLVLAPVFAAVALAIRLDSDGPVLFSQRRIGRDGRAFSILKFRTMCSDAEALRASLSALNQASGLFKIREDPRITRPGRWLRQTSLDELPQLLNVLRGDMSLVGPRPLIPEEDAQIVGWRRRRLDVAPGMTGHWQVLGGPRVPLEEMVMIDYLYVANWSLWRDVKCLLRTAKCVVARRGI